MVYSLASQSRLHRLCQQPALDQLRAAFDPKLCFPMTHAERHADKPFGIAALGAKVNAATDRLDALSI